MSSVARLLDPGVERCTDYEDLMRGDASGVSFESTKHMPLVRDIISGPGKNPGKDVSYSQVYAACWGRIVFWRQSMQVCKVRFLLGLSERKTRRPFCSTLHQSSTRMMLIA